MNKKYIIVALSIIALLIFNFSLKPYLRRRDAVKVVSTVLVHWENDNLTLAMPYWKKEIDSPPVYGLINSQIGNSEFYKKDGTYSAEITATLDFPFDNLLPSGKEWIFDLKKTRVGWKIINFQLSEEHLPK